MLRVAAGMTGVAFVLAASVVLVSGIPWPLPVAVYLFWGPMSALICEGIAHGNPLVADSKAKSPEAREKPRLVWIPATATVVVLALLAGGIGVYAFGVAFSKTFGYAAMIIAGAMSVNAIVMEVEDNAPGGWLRPDTWGDRKK